MAGRLELRGLTRRYDTGGGIRAIDLDVAPGELLALTGPSGSGKSTLVRVVAGLEAPDSGVILIDGRDVTKLPPPERGVGMTFDDGALYEHLDVRGNIEAAFDRVRQRGASGPDAVVAAARLVGAEHLLDRRPATLSAGERRRAALARALVRQPALLLLDEPLTHLDRAGRIDLREDLRSATRASATTTLLVTHDHEDAMAVADRIAFLAQGQLLQIGAAAELLARPAHIDVARGFGPVPMNLVDIGGGRIGFRPQHARISLETPTGGWTAEGTIAHVGPDSMTIVLAGETRVRLPASQRAGTIGERVRIAVDAANITRFRENGARVD